MIPERKRQAMPSAGALVIDGRRRVLAYLLAVLTVVYFGAVVASNFDTNGAGAVGEMWAAAISAAGFLALVPRRPSPWWHGFAVACAALAPPLTMVFHEQLVGQVWALMPAMFLALYIRAMYPVAIARTMCAAVAALSVTALMLAPAPAPILWAVLYVACILTAAELFGALGADLIAGALRDPLTAVWNRAGVTYAAAQLANQAARRSKTIGVIVFDVDHFKAVNDKDGHAAGDRILAELADQWTATAPAGSVVARLGGDEFAVIVAGYDEGQMDALARRLIEGHPVGVSYGTALGSPDVDMLESLLRLADADMYRRKALRRKL